MVQTVNEQHNVKGDKEIVCEEEEIVAHGATEEGQSTSKHEGNNDPKDETRKTRIGVKEKCRDSGALDGRVVAQMAHAVHQRGKQDHHRNDLQRDKRVTDTCA